MPAILAIPVIHSAGGWIASAAGSYLPGTLASSWAGSFMLGNAAFLKGLGIGIAGTAATAGGAIYAGVTGAATAGGVALGIIPATFLGLTPLGWSIAGASVLATAGAWAVYRYKYREPLGVIDRNLQLINEEREKGGLPSFSSSWELIKSLFSQDDEKDKQGS